MLGYTDPILNRWMLIWVSRGLAPGLSVSQEKDRNDPLKKSPLSCPDDL